MVAYYKFERSFRDVCFGNNAFNNALYDVSLDFSSGIVNGAAYFKSSPSQLVVPALKGHQWGSKFSVSLWFKRTASYTGIQGLINNGGNDQDGNNGSGMTSK